MTPSVLGVLIALRIVPYAGVAIISLMSRQPRLAVAAVLGIGLALLALYPGAPDVVKEGLRALFSFFLLWHAYDIVKRIDKEKR